jgi:hypothetical protein
MKKTITPPVSTLSDQNVANQIHYVFKEEKICSCDICQEEQEKERDMESVRKRLDELSEAGHQSI